MGSEMCIRDRVRLDHARVPALAARRNYDEAPTHAYTGGGGLRAEAAARASPYVSDGCVRVGGFHPGHDAYCQGRYLADNIASWALAGLLVQTHGRQRPDVAVAVLRPGPPSNAPATSGQRSQSPNGFSPNPSPS